MIALHRVQPVTSACHGWCEDHEERGDELIHRSALVEWIGEKASLTSVALRLHERSDAVGPVVLDLCIDGHEVEYPLADARTLGDALDELVTATEKKR